MESIVLNKDTKLHYGTSVALGFFDGIHLGHRMLIEIMKKRAKEKKLHSCVVTFDRHPLTIAFPKYAPMLILSNEEKVEILETMNIDQLVFLKFTEEMMNYEPVRFVEKILVGQLNIKHVVVGFNYNFGYKGMGSPQLLNQLGKKHGFEVEIVGEYQVGCQTVSSSFIRNLISTGKVDAVEKYMGTKFSISGEVIEGKKIGRQFNFPTANIEVKENQITPEPGVYYTRVIYKEKEYHALTNVGDNPTFKNHPFRIESYIYDFSEIIYGEKIKVIFYKRIRKEKKFNNMNDLFKQIEHDIATIKEKYVLSSSKF